MDKSALYILITNSTALEGSSLSLAQNTVLFDKGVSSEGKTIAEQLLNLDLKAAYEEAFKDAGDHQMWNGYRIKLLAGKALGSFGFDCSRVSCEETLHRICNEANEARMHSRTLGEAGIYAASIAVHFRFSAASLWPEGNDMMGRLMMNALQVEFGLEPLSVKDFGKYSSLLSAAVRDNDPDAFAAKAAGVLAKVSRCPKGASAVKTGIRILQLLSSNPRYTTAELAGILHISAKGVEKHLAQLKKNGSLQRVGPDKGGHWQVLRMY
jgi:hypothetical protein